MLKFLSPAAKQARNLASEIRVITSQVNRFYSAQHNWIPSPHEDCELPNTTVVQRFFDTCGRWPKNVAMECGVTGRQYTFEQLRVLIRRFGSSLTRMGFKRGETFGLLLPNIPEYPVALLGASGIGMPVALINPSYTADEIALLCQKNQVAALVGVAAMTPILRRVGQLCPSIRQKILIGGCEEGFASIGDMFKDPGDLFDENIDINPMEDVFVLPHSSGTTGLPKSVMLTNFNILANIQQGMKSVGEGQLGLTDDNRDVYVCVLPFTHIYGLVAQLLTVLDTGAKAVTLPKFDVQSFLKAIYASKPSILYVAPPIVSFLTQFPGLQMDAFRNLNVLFSGGAPANPASVAKLMERFDGFKFTFREGYGCTETSPVTHFTPHINGKIGSIGFPISRTTAKVIDVDTGEALGPNEKGELCILGPQIMKGYLNNPEATKEVIDSDGWLHTGDVAYYDDDKYFFIVDRMKELIKVKGLQVSPSEMEGIIRQHPSVLDAGVIGVPDDYAGELPRAYVVVKPGASLTEEDLKIFVHPKVAPHKQLKGGVYFVESLPLSAAGKILRRELKAQALKK